MKWKSKRLLTVLNYPDFRVGAARTLQWKYPAQSSQFSAAKGNFRRQKAIAADNAAED
jgi:hypothetical protein